MLFTCRSFCASYLSLLAESVGSTGSSSEEHYLGGCLSLLKLILPFKTYCKKFVGCLAKVLGRYHSVSENAQLLAFAVIRKMLLCMQRTKDAASFTELTLKVRFGLPFAYPFRTCTSLTLQRRELEALVLATTPAATTSGCCRTASSSCSQST